MHKSPLLIVDENYSMIGWREWVCLPDLGIPRIKAKIDTGAKTSSLHAFSIERFRRNHKDKVRFAIHPLQRNKNKVVVCEADIIDLRRVSNSGGHAEQRYVIHTAFFLGHDMPRNIEITLANRDSMSFRMLLGRNAIKDHYIVNVSKSYLRGKKKRRD